jgi:hypothetical protein
MVAFALSSLSGNARAWGYNLFLADRDDLPDYTTFTQKLAHISTCYFSAP